MKIYFELFSTIFNLKLVTSNQDSKKFFKFNNHDFIFFSLKKL
jgi:hypothetical protein